MSAAVILAEGVEKWFGAAHVLKGCSLSVSRGEVVVICGPSGSGKSTFIKCMNGLEPFQRGRILVEGVSVGEPATDLPKLRARIGMVFQHFELYPHKSVIENITLAPMHVLKRSRGEAEDGARALLRRVGLADKDRAFPSELSGGQQQRVAIARALAMEPVAMLFDEPTSSLDPEMISEVLDVIGQLAAEGMTMVVVTHEMGFARAAADRVAFMDAGRVLEDRPTAEFFENPEAGRSKMFLSKILRH
jgi:glutamate/aspartate transport system ATP-binding protein